MGPNMGPMDPSMYASMAGYGTMMGGPPMGAGMDGMMDMGRGQNGVVLLVSNLPDEVG